MGKDLGTADSDFSHSDAVAGAGSDMDQHGAGRRRRKRRQRRRSASGGSSAGAESDVNASAYHALNCSGVPPECNAAATLTPAPISQIDSAAVAYHPDKAAVDECDDDDVEPARKVAKHSHVGT